MNLLRSTSRTILGAALLSLASLGCSGSASGPAAAGESPATGASNGGSSAGGGDNATTGTTSGTSNGGGTGGSLAGGGGGTVTAPHAQHKRCAWIGADTFDAGKAAFLANPDWFDAIHPVWFTLTASGAPRQLTMADDAELMAAAHAHGVKVIPLVDGNTDSYMRTAFATPASIAAHADALAKLAHDHGYDGLELDYEHLWLASDRPGYTALIQAVADRLHADGKVLTLALPALSTSYTGNGYDYAVLQKSVDVMHLMGYDFHYLGGDHIGPIAPKGWIEDVTTYVQSLGAPERYNLGIANYGIGNGWYTTAKDAAARCLNTAVSEATDHMATCPLGHQDAGLAPHCETAQGTVWFEDAGSAGEKAAVAKAHGLNGVAYYTLGDEPTGFFDALAASF